MLYGELVLAYGKNEERSFTFYVESLDSGEEEKSEYAAVELEVDKTHFIYTPNAQGALLSTGYAEYVVWGNPEIYKRLHNVMKTGIERVAERSRVA